MTWRTWFARCRRGHDWFPGEPPDGYVSGNVRSEFIPTVDVCLRCDAIRLGLPTGTCLHGGHGLAQHYELLAESPYLKVVPYKDCPGPA